jgi:hypothetical protein
MPSQRTQQICRLIFLLVFTQTLTNGAHAQVSTASTQTNLLAKYPLPSEDLSTAHFKEIRRTKPGINRKAFVAMSAAVYGFAFLDMHETMSLEPGLIEHDPLARPFTKLPPPAYYVTGAALATGVNFIAWKLGRSRRWHKFWWIPQAASAYGNVYGYGTTKARE